MTAFFVAKSIHKRWNFSNKKINGLKASSRNTGNSSYLAGSSVDFFHPCFMNEVVII